LLTLLYTTWFTQPIQSKQILIDENSLLVLAVFDNSCEVIRVYLYVQGKNVVDACKENGIQHLVFSGLRSAKEKAGLEGCSHFENKKVIFDYIVEKGACTIRITTFIA